MNLSIDEKKLNFSRYGWHFDLSRYEWGLGLSRDLSRIGTPIRYLSYRDGSSRYQVLDLSRSRNLELSRRCVNLSRRSFSYLSGNPDVSRALVLCRRSIGRRRRNLGIL